MIIFPRSEIGKDMSLTLRTHPDDRLIQLKLENADSNNNSR